MYKNIKNNTKRVEGCANINIKKCNAKKLSWYKNLVEATTFKSNKSNKVSKIKHSMT